MKLTITQMNKWFVVQYGDNKMAMLNLKSLTWHLKHFGATQAERNHILHDLNTKSTVTVNLKKVG